MQIHIDRGGQRFGPYGLEEVKAHLASGVLLSTDLGWADGMQDWVPLTQLPGVTAPGIAPPPPHTSVGQSAGKKKLFIGIGATVGVCVIGVAVWFLFIKGDAGKANAVDGSDGKRAGQTLAEFIKDKRIYTAHNDENLGIVYGITQFNADGTLFYGVEHSGSMRIQRPEKVQHRYEVNGLVIKVVESQQGVEDKEFTITFQNVPVIEGDNHVFQSSDGVSQTESVAKVTSGPF